ncbi:MAG: Alanine racemase 1 [Fimbriimonadaceae bacterium]|nr:Alanine racemase 1 [Fimbriimonadaceae bacterium]
MIPYPRTYVEINLPNLAHNLGIVGSALQGTNTKVALVVKADAYGHGLVPVTRFALQHGADWAAVATVQEGIALRDAGVQAPIAVISPILPIEAEQAVFYRLRVLVERTETAEALSAAAEAQASEAIIHLEIDTGLSRFGCRPDDAVCIGRRIRDLPRTRLEGVSTHFSNSGFDRAWTLTQLQIFHQTLDRLRAEGVSFDMVHAANSAGAVNYPESRFDLVRIGILGYGIDIYSLAPIGVARPVMSWKARVMALRELEPHSPVGYARSYFTTKPTRIASLGVGYGDGYPRSLSNKGIVWFNGRNLKVVGLVCMDQLLVDATESPELQIGDEVELLGPNITALQLAEICDTNPHEIVTRVMSRVPRRYIYE